MAQRVIAAIALFAFGFVCTAVAETKNSEPVPLLLSLGDHVKETPVGTTEKTVTFKSETTALKVPDADKTLETLEVKVFNAMKHIEYIPTVPGTGEGTTSVWFRIAGPDDAATVCNSGECWGTYQLTSDKNGVFSKVEPSKVYASRKSLQLLNDSAVTLCMGITAPAEGTISAKALPVRYSPKKRSCDQPTARVSGYWDSSFKCTDSCTGTEENQRVTIYITQDPTNPTKVSYVDTEGAKYSGTLCGNTFTYTGGGSDWTESGTIVFESAASASKRSQYSSHGKCCVGHCSDVLSKRVGDGS